MHGPSTQLPIMARWQARVHRLCARPAGKQHAWMPFVWLACTWLASMLTEYTGKPWRAFWEASKLCW